MGLFDRFKPKQQQVSPAAPPAPQGEVAVAEAPDPVPAKSAEREHKPRPAAPPATVPPCPPVKLNAAGRIDWTPELRAWAQDNRAAGPRPLAALISERVGKEIKPSVVSSALFAWGQRPEKVGAPVTPPPAVRYLGDSGRIDWLKLEPWLRHNESAGAGRLAEVLTERTGTEVDRVTVQGALARLRKRAADGNGHKPKASPGRPKRQTEQPATATDNWGGLTEEEPTTAPAPRPRAAAPAPAKPRQEKTAATSFAGPSPLAEPIWYENDFGPRMLRAMLKRDLIAVCAVTGQTEDYVLDRIMEMLEEASR